MAGNINLLYADTRGCTQASRLIIYLAHMYTHILSLPKVHLLDHL